MKIKMKMSMIALALALGLPVSTAAIAADDFGRLFTTPIERANLDYLRKTTPLPSITQDQPAGTGEVAAPVLAPSPVSVQGYVKRSDGKKGTVWVNGAPVQESSNNSEVQVGKLRRNSNEVPIKLQAGGKSVNLKAGQSYDPETGKVSEANAHAGKMAKEEGENSGTIGFDPAELHDNKSSPNVNP